jgi:hypothetical protein
MLMQQQSIVLSLECQNSNLRKKFTDQNYHMAVKHEGRSQWPRCLGHEPSSPARKLGSWFRIPLEE